MRHRNKLNILSGSLRCFFPLSVVFFIAGIIFISLAFVSWYFEQKYQGRIWQGAKVGNFDFSGFTEAEAREILENYDGKLHQQGINVSFAGYAFKIKPQIFAASDLDLSYSVIEFDIDRTLDKLFQAGRGSNLISVWRKRLNNYIDEAQIRPIFKLNQEEIREILTANFSNKITPAKNAGLKLVKHGSSLDIKIKSEEIGEKLDFSQAILVLQNRLDNFSLDEIVLHATVDYPKIKKQNIEDKREEILSFWQTFSGIVLHFSDQDKNWPIKKSLLQQWLELESRADQIVLQLSEQSLVDFLIDMKSEIDIPVQEARFVKSKGRVQEFAPSREGRKLNLAASAQKINQKFINFYSSKQNLLSSPIDNSSENHQTKAGWQAVDLQVDIIRPQFTTESVNDLGIKDSVGVGKSSYAVSPVNRQHNIKVGADSLNGILIPPGEEFSLNKTLGEINEETGYLPELVIKGNKTIPEFGGGLCQIATTLFRLVLNTGLKITQRQNHSYRVSYYEPAGTDATIYSPYVDFKFINDTENYLLLQTKVDQENQKLAFEFWGTADSRAVYMSDPLIYNIKEPPPTEYIETEDLKPGEEKCTERSHQGASAKFDYKITYNSGEVFEKEYISVYRPWQAVCLIGVEGAESESGEARETKNEQS